jgi:hypothetical protein
MLNRQFRWKKMVLKKMMKMKVKLEDHGYFQQLIYTKPTQVRAFMLFVVIL